MKKVSLLGSNLHSLSLYPTSLPLPFPQPVPGWAATPPRSGMCRVGGQFAGGQEEGTERQGSPQESDTVTRPFNLVGSIPRPFPGNETIVRLSESLVSHSVLDIPHFLFHWDMFHWLISCTMVMWDIDARLSIDRQHKDRAAQNEQTVETLGSHLEETVRFGEVLSWPTLLVLSAPTRKVWEDNYNTHPKFQSIFVILSYCDSWVTSFLSLLLSDIRTRTAENQADQVHERKIQTRGRDWHTLCVCFFFSSHTYLHVFM